MGSMCLLSVSFVKSVIKFSLLVNNDLVFITNFFYKLLFSRWIILRKVLAFASMVSHIQYVLLVC